MKRGSKGSIVIIMTGLLTQIYYCYPWIRGRSAYLYRTYLAVGSLSGRRCGRACGAGVSVKSGAGWKCGGICTAVYRDRACGDNRSAVDGRDDTGGSFRRLFKLGSTIALVLGGACCMIIANPVAPDGVFIGNREILSDLPYIYPYFLVVVAGIFFWSFERWRPGMKGPGGCIRTGGT